MKIAAFNVQRLGWTKVNKEDVREIIIEIISQYSVVVLVEVMDKTGPSADPKDECSDAMPLLLEHLNAYGDNRRNPYDMECSDPLGSKGHKEKFVYFYREKEVEEITPYQYEGNAVITRQPFIVRLNCPNTVKMKIAAFNVQRLGWTKVNKEDVREIIIEIISQYSVVLLVEVTDKTGPSADPKDECSDAMPLLLEHLNAYGDNGSNPYKMECSERLGQTTHKEKFVYFYRKKEVEEIRCYQYEGKAVITRKPFIVRLNCPNTVVQNLVLISVHTKPSNAEAELIALHGVVEDVRKELKTDNIMILGDFNADLPSLSKKKKEALRISSAPYHWLIDDDVDTTTTKKKQSAYDRIVVYGESMLKAIVPNSAKAYNFEEELKLKEEQTQSVSDHYPVEVEVELKLKVKPEVELKLKVKPEVELEEQMGKLELGKKESSVTLTGGKPPGAQKKKAGPGATKGKGV